MAAKERVRRDYVAECLVMKDMTKHEIRILSGGRKGKRIFQRMRRAGVALSINESLRERVKGMPLRNLLIEAEAAIKDKEYAYD